MKSEEDSDAAISVDAAVDVDAAVGQPDASLACVPNAVNCVDATLSECDATGQVPTETACPLGCMGPSRCANVDPSNGLASNLDTAATTLDVTFTGTATIDTSAGVISDSSGALALSTAVITGGPVDLFVIEVKSLTASDINVIGNRALAIVSDGDITISGLLDVSADLNRPGAGALNGTSSYQGGQGGVSGAQVAAVAADLDGLVDRRGWRSWRRSGRNELGKCHAPATSILRQLTSELIQDPVVARFSL